VVACYTSDDLNMVLTLVFCLFMSIDGRLLKSSSKFVCRYGDELVKMNGYKQRPQTVTNLLTSDIFSKILLCRLEY
jgi:hypothetical protein